MNYSNLKGGSSESHKKEVGMRVSLFDEEGGGCSIYLYVIAVQIWLVNLTWDQSKVMAFTVEHSALLEDSRDKKKYFVPTSINLCLVHCIVHTLWSVFLFVFSIPCS